MSSHAVLRGLAVALFSFSVVVFSGALSAQPDAVRRAGDLMKENKAAEAYALLAPLENELAGNVDYDYLLGISALDSGKPDKATLAFERVVAVKPDFAGARLDMARAYFLLGDLARARSEFETVSRQNPPDGARQVIAKYLEAIEQAEKAQRRTVRLHLEYAIGHDTNINNSTSQSTVAVPALGNLTFTLNPTNVETRGTFSHYQGGADYEEKINPEFSFFAGLQWRGRDNWNSNTFDSGNLDLRYGVSVGPTDSRLTFTGNAGRYEVASELNRTAEGLGAEWRYALSPRNQISVFSQFSRTRFTSDATAVNSFNATTTGIGGLHILGDGTAAVNAAVFFGRERDVAGRADGPKQFFGLRVGGLMQLRSDIDLYGSLTFQGGEYQKENAAFLVKRGDDTTDLALGLAWRFMRDWTFRPQITYTRNTSNVAINRFDRTEAMFLLRRDFNY